MYLTSPPGDSHRLFIVTRPGVIRVVVDGVLQTTPFVDISSQVWQSGEAGMASMAFDPGYENAASPGYGLFYVYWVHTPTGGESNGAIHVTEFHTDPAISPNVANSTGRDVLVIPHNDANNHYGGTIAFGPDDDLYIAPGDGGGGDNQFGNAQDTKKSLLGKLLRIDPHVAGPNPYTTPPGNPFAGQPLCNPPSGTTNCPEILAWGLRNPFRWSFDSATGDLAIGDVGQSKEEEIDYMPAAGTLAGDNFGWPCREGLVVGPNSDPGCSAATLTEPVFAYSHSDPGLSGSIAITGGVVVRDPALTTLFGRYLYADFYAGIVHSLQLGTPSASGDRVETDLGKLTQLVNFGQDADGHVYIVQLSGTVSRLSCSDCTPPAGGGDTGGGAGGQSPPASPSDQSGSTTVPDAPVVRDLTAPRLRIRDQRIQDLLRTSIVRLSIVCDERCFVRAAGSARGLAIASVLKRMAADKPQLFELRLSKRLRRALAHRGVVTITLRARDAAGNLRTASLTVRVKR